MKCKCLNLTLLSCAMLSISSVFADTIEFQDGSKIIGEVTTINENKINIKTKYLGEVSFDLSSVKNYTIEDKKLNVAVKNGETFTGEKMLGNNKLVTLKSKKAPEGAFSLKAENVDRAWDATLVDPASPSSFKNKWNFELGAGIKGKTGNGESKDIDVNGLVTFEANQITMKAYLLALYAKNNRELTDYKAIGGLDFEYRFGSMSSFYVRDEVQRDNVKSLEFRNVLAAGYGIYFLKNDKATLRYRIGLGHTFESYNYASEDKNAVALDMGLYFMWNITKHTSLISELTYNPSLEDFNDYRIWHESKIRTNLQQINNCYLEAGIQNEYYSIVNFGNDNLDTNYFMRIVFKW